MAGGNPGWQVAGEAELKGKPETGKLAGEFTLRSRVSAVGYQVQGFGCRCRYGVIHFQVTGDGHQGIGQSGVGISAIGCRLRVPGG